MFQTQALRLISLFTTLITVVFLLKINPLRWVNLYQGLLIAHYLLAFVYVRKGTFGDAPKLFFHILGIGILSYVSYLYFPNLIFLFFGLHYAFGEAYNFRHLDRNFDIFHKSFFALAITFHFLIYLNAFSFNLIQLQIIHNYSAINFSPYLKFSSLVTFSCLVIYLLSILFKKRLSFQNFAMLIIVEGGLLWSSMVLSETRFPFIIAIFYHITFWFFASLWRGVVAKTGIKYFLIIISSNIIFILLSYFVTDQTVDVFIGYKTKGTLDLSLYLLGFFHIYSSLYNENMNPLWLKKILKVKKCSSQA